ncbi:MAG: branched-chain amino acid ABC transporter permease, partial [Betaproteobacteria bacterium]
GIDVQRVQWLAFVLAGVFCGVAGALFAFSKGSISPETIHIGRSVDALIMVLLGGAQTLSGPLVGSVVFSTLQDILIRETEYWRAVLGAVILFLVLAFPQGLAGFVRSVFEPRGRAA